MKQYTYCIKNIKNGSASCSSPKVIWITGTGQAVPCPEKGDNCITIQVPDDISACVSGEIICENCGDCPSKPFTICPCTTSQDCSECQICNNGICTDLCENQCINGQCVDCLSAEDCTANEICVNGHCQCPPSAPYKNDHGDCVECKADNHCSACEVCIGGECVAKVCPEGICNPTTGTCVGCLGSGDCSSRTDGKTCCANSACSCCPGFRWNPQLNICEVSPECVSDSDCSVCEICVAGDCQPRICPNGTICINDTCVPICDCNEPLCSRSAACIRYNQDTCICQDCSGSCADDIPCKDGCICVNNNCVPNKCNSPCASGADCGLGCGCLNNQCVPCEYLSCQEEKCQLADGCNCYGSECKGDPCKGPCENGADCGPGCGCLNGNCVSCSSLDCTECPGVLGCACNNGICLKDAPCSGKCGSSWDCPNGCTCYQGNCVNCSYFSCEDCDHDDCECLSGKCQGTDKECADTFILEKIEGTCDLKATLITDRGCTCEGLEAQLKIVNKVPQTLTLRGVSVPANKYTYQLRLFRDGNEIGYPIVNDKFLDGTLRLKVTWYYTDSTAAGTFEDSAFVNYDLTGLSSDISKMLTFPNLVSTTGAGKTINVKKILVQLEETERIIHTNGCQYTGEDEETMLIEKEQSTTPVINENNVFDLESLDFRSPLFQWHRAASSSFAADDAEFRWVYATNLGTNTYTDTITNCDDGLCSGLHYKVTTDCSCKDETNTIKAIFCPSPFTFNYAITNCGKTITITDLFTPCDVNSNLSPCNNCNLNILPVNQVAWIMKVTDDLGNVTTKNLIFDDPSDIIDDVNYSPISMTGNIINVSIEHNQDPSCKLVEEIDPAGIASNITFNCNTNAMTVVIPGTPGCSVQLRNATTDALLQSSTTDVTGTVIFSSVASGIYKIVSTCSGCSVTENYTVNCCTEGGTVNATYTTGTLQMQVVPGHGSRTYSYTLVKPDTSIVLLASGQSFNYNHAITLTNGSHTIIVEDSTGCTYTSPVLEVNNCNSTVINAIVNYSYVAGPPVVETLTVTGIAGSVSPYVVTLSYNGSVLFTNNGVTSSTSFNAATLISGNTYTVSITDAQNPACTKSVNYLLNKQAQCNPQVDLTITASGNCSPIQYAFWVNNATVPYKIYIKQGGGIIPNGQTNHKLTAGVTDTAYIVATGQDAQGRDNYYFQNLPDGDYTIEVVDARGCKDTETVAIDCVCSNPLLVDIAGVSCDDAVQGLGHNINITNITGGQNSTVNIYVYGGSLNDGDICAPSALLAYKLNHPVNTPTSIFIPSGDVEPYPGNYYISVSDGGVCNNGCIAVPTPDCSDPGGGGFEGSPDCPLTEADFTISGDCAITLTNDSAISVQARIQAIDDGDCQNGNTLGNSSYVTLAPAASHVFNAMYPGLQHRFEIVYDKQVTIGDPVPCNLKICAPCSTSPSCTLTTQPEVCKTRIPSGASPTGYIYRLNVANVGNANTVLAEASINGGSTINLGTIAPGGSVVYSVGYNDYTNVYVKFTCMNDLNEIIDITINNIPLGC